MSENEPSAAAMAAAEKFAEWLEAIHATRTPMSDEEFARELAHSFDAYAAARVAEAVAAERARIESELRAKLQRALELVEQGHDFASDHAAAFSTAIAIAQGEGQT